MMNLRIVKNLKCQRRNFIRCLSTINSASSNKSDLIVVENHDGFSAISFNRPPMSSFTLELLDLFSKALDSVNNDEKCKGLIISSVKFNLVTDMVNDKFYFRHQQLPSQLVLT